ncbi:DEAD/DEAH box helicase [Anaeromicropila herbilytica]|uniref:DEAD/DEAH box helicase n=1 Tax=Anaeromicropila herbilytica TaxID=2785025 RepID=A0A7R7EJF2_9FIRM|nr:DEAD/DEAH box helicase [Anaeromicropila herbilytica]BCN29878.1 DEAD/DEAH box helicase [Anaeromicropila herbilytica]
MSSNSLDLFHPHTAAWFQRTLGTPTKVQEEAWPAIASGCDTLVSAPTGTGKTLSAFLVFIDRLKEEARRGTLTNELHLIYISPLKSLAGDIRENLNRPIHGILEEEYKEDSKSNSTPFDLNIAIRTGDTTQNDRRKMIKKPPHILITTPESLYLMLTSKSGKSILHTAKAIIIDELHAMIDSKRGSHLMLSIARLDKLCGKPLQRIGLSATIEPLEVAAEYLSPDQVTIVAPKMEKKVEFNITSPLTDYHVLQKDSIWQEIASAIYEQCRKAKSVIAFVEGRTPAEKLAFYVNGLAGEGYARTHHGSLSKEQRLEVEQDLRDGNLHLLCATSSMELGIDVGDIDQVIQIGCPRTISSTMQRLGRAGHNPGRTSVMYMYPRFASEGLYCGLTAKVAKDGGVEYSAPPRLCLDILAQHLVSMAGGEGYSVDEVMELLKRAYPFREVTKEDVKDVLCMLAGDYEHERDLPVRPRILYDRIHEYVEGDAYSRILAISAGGTIPDKGMYAAKTESGVKLGELEEEFVFEARIGDKFLLGSFAWQIAKIQKDCVIVRPTNTIGAKPPFWKGEIKGRRVKTGKAFGAILRELGDAYEKNQLLEELEQLGLDESTAKRAEDYLKRQIEATNVLPDDRTILLEHFKDDTGNNQMMVHSVYGRQINMPLAILTKEIAKKITQSDINYVEDDDGFLLFPYGEGEIPEGLLYKIQPEQVKGILEAVLPATPIFNMTFRYNAGHALMMGVRRSGRQPLWVQRMRSAEMLDSVVRYGRHPLIRETKRECLEDYWDLKGLEDILYGIQSGSIQVREMYLDIPSPMSLPLRQQTEASMMYDYTPTPIGVHLATGDALEQTLEESEKIEPEREHLERVSERGRMPEDEKQLHSLLMIEGDLIAGELDVPIEWLEILVRRGQAKYIEPGLWIAAEQEDEYRVACEESTLQMEERMHIVRRLLRYRGAHTISQITERYLWPEEAVAEVLEGLCGSGSVVSKNGTSKLGKQSSDDSAENETIFYHAKLYERAREATIRSRRNEVKTQPAKAYASLLASRMVRNAPPTEQLESTLNLMSDQPYAIALWESALLPGRVSGYREQLLDTLLSKGNLFWRVNGDSELSFHRAEDIDWDADLSSRLEQLEGNEKIIYEALLKRGASFMQRLGSLLEGESPYDTLLSLASKGLICADSYVPVRQLQNIDKLNKGTAKQRASARVMALTAGRWEVSRPLIELTTEEKLERIFERVIILCRETINGVFGVQGISWQEALETLRIWEYTGRVRRGYFIEGLSGIQFIREKDFAGTMLELSMPRNQIVWLSAVDSAQQWGKSIPHMENRSFLNVLGTVVALKEGLPIVVFERQGKILRLMQGDMNQGEKTDEKKGTSLGELSENELIELIRLFASDFNRKKIYAQVKRIVVKEYPKEAVEALEQAGFKKEMMDYVLYRN